MGRRSVVTELDDDQFTFVVESIIGGLTDREISAAFEKEFSQKLAKSSLSRWRKKAGNELADRYRLARYQSRQLLADLNEEEDADKFQVVMGNLEDRLLTATRQVIALDPVKALRLRLDEEKRRLKKRELDLKEKQIEIELEKARAIDREGLPGQISEYLLEFIGSDPIGLKWFKANARKLNDFLTEKYAS